MTDDLLVSLLLNISLLLLAATLLIEVKPLRELLRPQQRGGPLSQLLLAVTFGGMAILSTYCGMEVQGAIVNTRVISVTAAGLLGGPVAGLGAGLIGGLHRYFYQPESFTALGCCVGTICFGLVGAAAHPYLKGICLSKLRLSLLTIAGESLQVVWLLLLARPLSAVVELEQLIFLPKLFVNSLGMILFFGVLNRLNQTRLDEQIERQSKALYIADRCLPYLRQGLRPAHDLQTVADIIRENGAGYQVVITNRQRVLVTSGVDLPGEQLPAAVSQCLAEARPQVTKGGVLGQKEDAVCAPLTAGGEVIGTLSLILDEGELRISVADVRFTESLARLFSTILELNNLDYQIELRQQAEFRAFQSQINPHFLFNALNTISALCRSDPNQARQLLLVLANYYRQMLSINEDFVSLQTELYNVENYLTIARARFVDAIHVTFSLPEDISDCQLPPLTLQPLVENAVRHGGRAVDDRVVGLSIQREGDALRVAVSDQGPGFPPEILAELEDVASRRYSGLFNVNKRLVAIYGRSSRLQISSSSHGSVVSFTIPAQPPQKGACRG